MNHPHVSSAAQQSFFEKIQQFPPAEILQMCCLSRRNGEMTFQNGDMSGVIYLQQGEVVHASVDRLTGEEAAYEICSWPVGGFSFQADVLASYRTIQSSWEQLLVESTRRQNELAVATGGVGFDTPFSDDLGTFNRDHAAGRGSLRSEARSAQPRLTVYGSSAQGQSYDLNLPVMHLGRAATNEIVIQDASISGRHCVFITSGSDILLRDLNSSNGTFLNGQQVTEGILKVGDIIRAGTALLKFEMAIKRPRLREDAPPPPFSEQGATALLPKPAPARNSERTGPVAPISSGPISYDRISVRGRKASKPKAPSPVGILLVILLILAGAVAAIVFLRPDLLSTLLKNLPL